MVSLPQTTYRASFRHSLTQVYVARPKDDGNRDLWIYLWWWLWGGKLIICIESLNQKAYKISWTLHMQIVFENTNMQLFWGSNKATVLGLPRSTYLLGPMWNINIMFKKNLHDMRVVKDMIVLSRSYYLLVSSVDIFWVLCLLDNFISLDLFL